MSVIFKTPDEEKKKLKEPRDLKAHHQDKYLSQNDKSSTLDEIKNILEEIKNLREDFNKETKETWEEIKNIWGEIKNLREDTKKIFEEIKLLREEISKTREELKKDIGSVRKTVENTTISIEEEAKEVVNYRLREKLGIDIKLSDLVIKGTEIDIYGVSGEYCVIGEATIRAGKGIIEKLERKVRRLLKIIPELKSKKIIKVIYTLKITDEAIKLAEEKKIWVLKLDREYTSLTVE